MNYSCELPRSSLKLWDRRCSAWRTMHGGPLAWWTTCMEHAWWTIDGRPQAIRQRKCSSWTSMYQNFVCGAYRVSKHRSLEFGLVSTVTNFSICAPPPTPLAPAPTTGQHAPHAWGPGRPATVPGTWEAFLSLEICACTYPRITRQSRHERCGGASARPAVHRTRHQPVRAAGRPPLTLKI